MGRKSKQSISEIDDVNSTNENDELVNLLSKQVDELQKQIDSLKNSKSQSQPEEKKNDEYSNEKREKIDGREYIRVMSLSNIPLNLTTEPVGKGRLFQFSQFGEIKRIMYDDLIKIVYNHPTFTQTGRFIIMHSGVIRELGYEDDYAKILTKEKIESILENKQNAIDLYRTANDTQKKIIQEFLIRKTRDNLADVDMNLIVAIKQISDVDIIAESEKIKRSVLNETE